MQTSLELGHGLEPMLLHKTEANTAIKRTLPEECVTSMPGQKAAHKLTQLWGHSEAHRNRLRKLAHSMSLSRLGVKVVHSVVGQVECHESTLLKHYT